MFSLPFLDLVLPNHFWDGFGGAVAGGLLTALGALLGALLVRVLDSRRQGREADQEFRAAAKVVIDELTANRSSLDELLKQMYVALSQPPTFATDSFLRVQLILARRLSADEWRELHEVYTRLRRGAQAFMMGEVLDQVELQIAMRGTRTVPGPWRPRDGMAVDWTLKHLEASIHMLSARLEEPSTWRRIKESIAAAKETWLQKSNRT